MKLPKNVVAPPRKGPMTQRKSGAGVHGQGVRRQRSRAARELAAREDSSQ